MPWRYRNKLKRLNQDNDHLRQQIESLDHLLPFLQLARRIELQVIDALEEHPSLSATQIGDIALRKAFEQRINQAREELVYEYEQNHRDYMYQQVIDQVKESEGDAIFERVKIQLESDPELIVELHNSARAQIASHAQGLISEQITQGQQDLLASEAERQLALDQLDLELMLDGELDLHRDDIHELLRPGDEVELYYALNNNDDTASLTLKWLEDVNSTCGWTLAVAPQSRLRNSAGNFASLDSSLFIEICCILPDLQNGTRKPIPSLLKKGFQLAFLQQTPNKQSSPLWFMASKNWNDAFGTLIKTDFRTKTLDFK